MPSAIRDTAATQFAPATEKQFAERLNQFGKATVQHRGRYWRRMAWGFFEPVNYLARLDASEVSRPSWSCWGFRTSLAEGSRNLANGCMPMNLLADLQTYSAERLPAKRRSDLRKSERSVSFVQLTGPGLLQEQGYGVDLSAYRRTGFGKLPTPEHYRNPMKWYFPDEPHYLVIAGLVGDQLGGYLVASAIDDTVLIEKVSLATEHLPTAIGTGLLHQFIQICRRSPGLKQIVYGLLSPDQPSLVAFKEGMGFATTYEPAHIFMVPGARTLIRRKRPWTYYRLTGVLPPGFRPSA